MRTWGAAVLHPYAGLDYFVVPAGLVVESWFDIDGGTGEVATAGAGLIGFVIGHIDFDFVIATVIGVIGRVIGYGILVAKFFADVLKRLIEIIDVIREERAAAGFFR